MKEGVGMELCDRLTGELRYVHEKLASEVLSLRMAICGRVVDFEEISVLCALHPTPLGAHGSRSVTGRSASP